MEERNHGGCGKPSDYDRDNSDKPAIVTSEVDKLRDQLKQAEGRLKAINSELLLMQGDTVEASQSATQAHIVATLLRVLDTGLNRYGDTYE